MSDMRPLPPLTEEEAQALGAPTPEEIARATAKWRAKVRRRYAGLIDAQPTTEPGDAENA